MECKKTGSIRSTISYGSIATSRSWHPTTVRTCRPLSLSCRKPATVYRFRPYARMTDYQRLPTCLHCLHCHTVTSRCTTPNAYSTTASNTTTCAYHLYCCYGSRASLYTHGLHSQVHHTCTGMNHPAVKLQTLHCCAITSVVQRHVTLHITHLITTRSERACKTTTHTLLLTAVILATSLDA